MGAPWAVVALGTEGSAHDAPARHGDAGRDRRAEQSSCAPRGAAADLHTRRGRVCALAEQLVAAATGGEGADDARYAQLRQELLTDPAVGPRIPRYVRMARDLGHFRQWVRDQRPSYDGRRELIWTDFGPILEHIARVEGAPRRVDARRVHELWREALVRCADDPDGATRAARALLEAVCRSVLDGCRVPYAADARLPRLYQLATGQLAGLAAGESGAMGEYLADGCHAVVDAVGSAHRWPAEAAVWRTAHTAPSPRHAELAVNLAGSVALFLVAAFDARGGAG